MTVLFRRAVVCAVASLVLSACSRSKQTGMMESASTSPQTRSDGWTSLASLSQWRSYKSQQNPKGWSVEGNTLTKTGNGDDLVSRGEYQNFELSLDWKLAPGGNAGIFYRGTEEYDKMYWSATEYQLLDDARHPDGKNPLTTAASAYGFYAPPAGVVHAGGEWNSTRIIARGNHVEHWLNGQKVVEYDYGSPDWEARLKKSKFAEWPHYGRSARGFIGIQGDHSGLLSIRDIKIRELP